MKPQLSMVFPVHNERATIERVLKEWVGVLARAKVPYEFVVSEDGSTDGTTELLHKLKKRYQLVLNQSPKRRGYAQAVLDGVQSARGTYVLCVDSDGQCDPKDFLKFWKNRQAADVVFGWRIKREDSLQRKIFSQAFHLAFQLLFPTPIRDPSCPYMLCPRAFFLKHVDQLTYLNEGFWWGFIAMCVKQRATIIELPVHHRRRFAGDTQVYVINKILGIAVGNFFGLLRLRFS